MHNYDPLDSIRQLRAWVGKTLSSMNEVPLAEARARYREIGKVVDKLERLRIPVSEEIRSERESLEALIRVSNEREKLASLSKELLSLARDINHQLRTVRGPGTSPGGKAPSKILRVTFSDGVVVFERTATATFIRCLQHVGLERIAELRSIRSHGHPLVSTRRNESGSSVHEVDGYFIETHSGTKRKAVQLQHISRALDIGMKVETLDA